MTMNPNNSTNSLYLDTDVAREQRQQAEAEMEINNAAHTEKQEGILQEGLLADMKHQLDTITSTNSVSDIGNSISSAAQENAVAVKEIIMDDAVPAAQDALHTVQDRISAISGKGAEETEYEDANAASREEIECIDKMSNEQICDFLRDKHMSYKLPRPTN